MAIVAGGDTHRVVWVRQVLAVHAGETSGLGGRHASALNSWNNLKNKVTFSITIQVVNFKIVFT